MTETQASSKEGWIYKRDPGFFSRWGRYWLIAAGRELVFFAVCLRFFHSASCFCISSYGHREKS